MSQQQLVPLEPITQLSPSVIRVLGQNAGTFTLQGTNTYLVGATDRKILIDAGDRDVKSYIQNLKSALGDARIVCIVCTHWHDDHIGGVKNVLEEVVKEKVPIYKMKRPDSDAEASFQYLSEGESVETDGVTLRSIATPGHTMDHMSLFYEEEHTLFSGDCILGQGTTIFEDLREYMISLQKLLKLEPKRIYPGHGPVVDNAVEKIGEYIAHRNRRENDIIEALKILKSASGMQITNHVYKDLNFFVKLAALNNVNHHLKKLLKEQRIIKVANDTYKMSSD